MKRIGLLLIAAAVSACQQPSPATAETPRQVAVAEDTVIAPLAIRQAAETAGPKTAIFAGGCFWGIEGIFSHVRGVTSAVSGYHGGSRGNASYSRVSAGDNGHAEAVFVVYDPAIIRYDQLLQVLFSVGTDPTQRNRQGPDVGTQYRSALVPLSQEQRVVASAYLAQLGASGLWTAPIATRIERFQKFYPAEGHHQDFMRFHPDHPYIQRWDAPKVAALQQLFPRMYKAGFTAN